MSAERAERDCDLTGHTMARVDDLAEGVRGFQMSRGKHAHFQDPHDDGE
jgi:hypothetical protein